MTALGVRAGAACDCGLHGWIGDVCVYMAESMRMGFPCCIVATREFALWAVIGSDVNVGAPARKGWVVMAAPARLLAQQF
jgi:hypothetical protein